MKKVGIITFHGSHNYGAMLQAYALQETCNELGTESSIIDFRTDEMINDYAIWKKSTDIRTIAKNMLQLLRYFSNRRKYNKFENFIKEYMRLTRRYSTLEQLMSNPPKMDVYITGSDQVWNGRGKLKTAYFLPFGCSGVHKISYAASLGDSLPKVEYEKEIKKYLQNLDAVSVREEMATEYIAELTGKSAVVLCDPVLLLSRYKWESLCRDNNRMSEPYVFCYYLGETGEMQEIIEKIKRITNLKVVTVCDSIKSGIKCDKVYYDAGPLDFLSFIKNAEFVITNSFHGTAFSILFEKPFYAVKRNQSSQRIMSLLKLFGLNDRYIATYREIQNLDIDYSNAEQIRHTLAKRAMLYLTQNFGIGGEV